MMYKSDPLTFSTPKPKKRTFSAGVQAFQQLKVAGDIIPSKQGTNELQTHHSLHDHLRARSMKLAQNKRACTSTKIWVHDSDDNMEEGELEEPFDAPWDEHVGPESITTVYG